MGEFADMLVDQIWDDFDADLDQDDEDFVPSFKVCRYCSTGFLRWGKTEKGFRLFDSEGKLHSCLPVKPIIKPKTMDATTRTFFIAGVQFTPSHKTYLAAGPKIGDVLKLVGEPNNKFDRYAVRIESPDGVVLGHVPKPINVDIWAVRDAGFKPIATLLLCVADAPTWERFKVSVSFEPKQK